MIDRIRHTYTISPNQVLVDAIVLRRDSIGKWHDCEPLLEEQQTNSLHHGDCVDLTGEKGLLSPHAADEEFLLFKQKGEDAVENMDGSLYLRELLLTLEHLDPYSCVMQNFDGLNKILLSKLYDLHATLYVLCYLFLSLLFV